MKAELVDYMGDDLRVVNAARVSFDKESNLVDGSEEASSSKAWEEMTGQKIFKQVLSEKDQKLISYLAKHNHWTPFSHVMITMRETVPIFVARQRFKHVVGFTYNEVSRRYVSDEPTFFQPDAWRQAADNKKQGSLDEVVEGSEDISFEYNRTMKMLQGFYEQLLDMKVAPEQARMVLPQSMYTSYYVTGSLAAWARAYQLRIDPHAQKEIQDLAVQWNSIITSIPELKYSWSALTDKKE
jgi:thymidylate synthase (FAD)